MYIQAQAEDDELLQVADPSHKVFHALEISPGHVAVLPGYTLERTTCGFVKATMHQVVCLN